MAALCEPFEFGDDPTALYRLFDAEDVLLYVGITTTPGVRMGQHADTKPWWPEVAKKTMTWYSSRREACNAEATAIDAEKPKHNQKTDTRSSAVLGRRMTIEDLAAAAEAGEWIHIGGMSVISPTRENWAKRWHADK